MQGFFARVVIIVDKMYHPPSKRQQLIQRLVVYSLMTITIAILVIILVFATLGYQFDQANGRVEQGGLVQLDTKSGSAAVTIDGTDFGAQTPTKTTLFPGQHIITMSAKGYDTWRKSVKVVAGSVLWLNYARLVPQTLNPTSAATFPAVTSTAVSPDQHWMAIKEAADTPVLHLADLSQDPVVLTTLTLPATSYTAPHPGMGQSFSIKTWDASSRYVLLKHTYDTNKTEWIVADTQDSKSTKNLTTSLGINATDVQFSTNNGQILYGLIDGSIRKMNLVDNTISAPLVQNVAEFSVYDSAILIYVTKPTADTKQQSVGYYTDGASQARILQSYADDGSVPLHIALGKYYGDTYEAIAYGGKVTISRGSLPRSDSTDSLSLKGVASMTLPDGVSQLSIRTSGRFVVMQHGSAYSVYDLELPRMTTTRLKSEAISTRKLTWIDGYYVADDQSGMVRLYEFDGANQHDIMPVVPGMSVTLTSNGKYLYGISKDDKGIYHLSRVQMIL